MVKKDPQKNMTELLLRFEINEVWKSFSVDYRMDSMQPSTQVSMCWL